MANFTDKANQILQNVLNYIQEGLKQEGFEVDFQNVVNSETNPQSNYTQQDYQQAYPKHPNADSEHY